MKSIIVKARAKLNLSLDVLAKRPDGFHDMRMVMQSAALCDDVRVELRHPGFFLADTNRSYIPRDERNVAIKAAKTFFEATGTNSGVYINITKRIPVCAGLGGGSSDAAAVLRALNILLNTGLDAAGLESIAAKVGSDVAFCVAGGTVLAEGRGEILTSLPPLPETPVVICMPHFSCSTPELFARIHQRSSRCKPDTPGIISALDAGDVKGVARRMYNIFEDVLDRRAAGTVSEIKIALLDAGAIGAAMSGSGSAVFGLFASDADAERAAAALKGTCNEVFLTQTIGREENL